MKRFMLLLILCLALITCGCDSDSSDESRRDRGSSSTDEFSLSNASSPSSAKVEEDISSALKEMNPHIKSHEFEIIKSLTEEITYSASVEINAKTTYAAWHYEAEVSYTKYDQGWMLDDVEFTGSDYQVELLPTEADVSSIIEAELSQNEAYSELHPADNIEIHESKNMQATLSSEITIDWKIKVDYLHGHFTTLCRASLYYNSSADIWSLRDENGSMNLENTSSDIVFHTDVDLSGDWQPEESTLYYFSISNFTPDAFDMKYNGPSSTLPQETMHLTLSSVPPAFIDKHNWLWYSAGNGYYVALNFQKNGTGIYLYQISGYSNIRILSTGYITETSGSTL